MFQLKQVARVSDNGRKSLPLFSEDPPPKPCCEWLFAPREFIFDVAFEFLVSFALGEHLALFSS